MELVGKPSQMVWVWVAFDLHVLVHSGDGYPAQSMGVRHTDTSQNLNHLTRAGEFIDISC